MYKIILVDDEPTFRKKFSQSINWENSGFTLEACLADGRDAIEYLKDHHVDVILSDIRMTFVSGVELAEHVSIYYPHIKVILNSGYSDFEYAQQAIEYGVYKYLLKPTKKSELEDSLKDLKKLLDKNTIKVDDEIYKLLQRQAMFDIYNGVLTDFDRISHRLRKIDLNVDINNIPCVYFCLEIIDIEQVIKQWKYNKDDLYTAIENILMETFDGYCTHFPINYTKNKIEIISVLSSKEFNQDIFDNNLNDFISSVDELLNIEIKFENLSTYPSILDLSKRSKSLKETSVSDFDKLKILFVNYFNSDDLDAAGSIADNILELIKNLSYDESKKELINLFELIENSTQTNCSIIIDNINNSTQGNFEEVCRQEFSNLLDMNHNTSSNYKSTIIAKAKEYVEQHYKEDISLENVADYVFLNKIYFCRFFKQTTGENFNDYLTLIRMNKAMEALKDPTIKIYEICEHVGYKTPRYFYKLFKNHTGLTPTEYRTKVLEEKRLS